MAIYDNHSTVYVENVLSADIYDFDTTRVSDIVDMKGFNSLEFIFNIGDLIPKTVGNTFTVQLFENDISDIGSATLVDPKYVIGDASFNGFAAFSEKRVGYVGKKRYVLLKVVISGNTEIRFSVIALKGRPDFAPTEEN